MSELIFNTPGFRRHAQSITYKGDYFVVLMAAAAEAYLQGRISKTMLWPVFKLHVTGDPGRRLKLTRRDHEALKTALSGREMWVPIYRWQGAGYLEDEEWANCLGVADTKRFVAVVVRAWKENWPVPRLGELSRIEIPSPKSGPPRFRDCGIWEAFAGPVIRKVTRFERPCVFFEWL
jgi:hypothetical protein